MYAKEQIKTNHKTYSIIDIIIIMSEINSKPQVNKARSV